MVLTSITAYRPITNPPYKKTTPPPPKKKTKKQQKNTKQVVDIHKIFMLVIIRNIEDKTNVMTKRFSLDLLLKNCPSVIFAVYVLQYEKSREIVQ